MPNSTKSASAIPTGWRWYAVYTKPQREAVATAVLQHDGFEVFYPKLRRRRFEREGAPWVVEPMFPRYVFIRLDLSLAHADVGYARGVVRLVNFAGKFPPIPDVLVEEIRCRGQQDVVTVEPEKLTLGEPVEVVIGPFQGFQGIFERESSSEERVVVLLKVLGQIVKTELERAVLERV